jgi:hypothetical protein
MEFVTLRIDPEEACLKVSKAEFEREQILF